MRAPQRHRRAKSHGAEFTCVTSALPVALLASVLGACGCAEGETNPLPSEPGDSNVRAQAPGAGTPSTSLLPAGLHDLERATPIFGEPNLAPDAIEIDPYELLPRDLPISEGARAQIVELVRALQPLDPSLTSDHHDKQFIQNKRLIEALERSTEADVGWAALHAFTNYPDRYFPIRRVLLAVGARVSPDKAEPILAELAFNYGFYIDDRAEAALLLAEIAPETFFEGTRPYLERQGKPFQTAPNDEFFVRGWLIACEHSDRSPVEMMAQVATNLAIEDYARVVAVRTLGAYADDPRARGAIQTTLVESTGNAYLRRMSAQAVIAGFPRETGCELLQEILEREADLNFARFLDEMIQFNCR